MGIGTLVPAGPVLDKTPRYTSRAAKAGRKIANKWYNATAKGAIREQKGGQFGNPKAKHVRQRRAAFKHSAYVGALGAGVAGGVALDTNANVSKPALQINRNQQQIARNSMAIRRAKREVSKASVHRITDMGTNAERLANKARLARPLLHRGGLAVGAGLVGASTAAGLGAQRAGQKTRLKRQRATLRGQQKTLEGLNKRLMSDTEIRRRKALQGHISQTTSTLGLTGLGITGAAALAAKKPGVLRAVKKVPGLKGATPHRMKNTAINTGIVSGGIGGVGGFNFASYTGAEAKKRRVPTVAKSEGASSLEMGYYAEVAKAWSPVATDYDPEARRHKRAEAYPKLAAGAAGASAVGAAGAGARAGYLHRKAGAHAATLKNPAASSTYRGLKAATRSHTKAAAALGAGAAAGGVAAGVLRRRKSSKSWASYGKADTVSAFGVDHQISKKMLSQGARDKIKAKNFAYPGSRSYPIQDKAHARNALARAAQSKTKGSYKKVAAAVHAKYPGIGS